jgi:hypothetical protein
MKKSGARVRSWPAKYRSALKLFAYPGKPEVIGAQSEDATEPRRRCRMQEIQELAQGRVNCIMRMIEGGSASLSGVGKGGSAPLTGTPTAHNGS